MIDIDGMLAAKNIKTVIKPFGKKLSRPACDTYLVQRTDGRLSIANITPVQSIGVLECKPWSFEKILDTPINKTCFKKFKHKSNYRILLGVEYDNHHKYKGAYSEMIYFWPLEETNYDPAIIHHVFKNREEILMAKSKDLTIEKLLTVYDIPWCTYVCGNLTFSEDGQKVSAYMPVSLTGMRRISTDAEVLAHAANNKSIIWYYDPE